MVVFGVFPWSMKFSSLFSVSCVGLRTGYAPETDWSAMSLWITTIGELVCSGTILWIMVWPLCRDNGDPLILFSKPGSNMRE